ncbi:hypothetical protein [Candidatus Thiodubiliella endoseptemdiera]|uniref:hypothetical protein n=1 Tax=Candidatus Thiodubiliella endoseptemdiera TaxID=2738886 RepID=UPI0034DFF018
MNFILRLFLTLSSISFFLIVFLVQNEINPFKTQLGNYAWVTYVVYVIVPFIFTFISLGICKLLTKSRINKVISIETSSNDFLANYLAFFFVALSAQGVITFWVVFGMTVLFTFVSRVSYFNPIFLVFGYNFYYIQTGEHVKVMLISRKKLKSPKTFENMSCRRINDYTFMEI